MISTQRRYLILTTIGISFLLGKSQIRASETFADLSTGELVFKATHEIAIESENIEVSQENVKVDYVFKNQREYPIETLLAFPLPDLESEESIPIHLDDWTKGKDPIHFTLFENLKLKKAKILTQKAFDDEVENIYRLKVNYTWNQTFPAHGTVQISHQFDSILAGGGSSEFSDEDRKSYCMTPDFLDAFERLKSRLKKKLSAGELSAYKGGLGAHMHFNSFQHFSYVLTTANNWSGPIGKFHLKIHKNSPSTLVSLCFENLKKVNDREISAEITGFKPAQDLKILFVNEK